MKKLIAIVTVMLLVVGCTADDTRRGSRNGTLPAKADSEGVLFLRDISSPQYRNLINQLVSQNGEHQLLVAEMQKQFSFDIAAADYVSSRAATDDAAIGISYRHTSTGARHAVIVSLYSAQSPHPPLHDYIEEYNKDSGEVFIHYVDGGTVKRVATETLR